MENLMLIDDLKFAILGDLISGGSGKIFIKVNNNNWPMLINLNEKKIEWEIALFSLNGNQLLLKSVFHGKDIKTDNIDTDLFNDIKDITNE